MLSNVKVVILTVFRVKTRLMYNYVQKHKILHCTLLREKKALWAPGSIHTLIKLN